MVGLGSCLKQPIYIASISHFKRCVSTTVLQCFFLQQKLQNGLVLCTELQLNLLHHIRAATFHICMTPLIKYFKMAQICVDSLKLVKIWANSCKFTQIQNSCKFMQICVDFNKLKQIPTKLNELTQLHMKSHKFAQTHINLRKFTLIQANKERSN